LTYLFGASPIAEANFFENGEQPLKRPVRSIRQSQKYGFENKFPGDYSSVENYAKKVMNAVKAGKLQSAAELHGQVRFKGNNDLNKMVKEGVDYIELRMLDLDPTSSVGIRTGTLRFIRLLTGYFIMSPSLKESEAGRVIARADEMNEHVALEDPTASCEYAPTAKALIRHLQLFVNQIQAGPEYQEILDDLEYRINHPETTPSGQLVEKIKNNSLVDYALHQARKYQDGAIQALRPFRGFEENNGNLSANELASDLFGGTWRLNKPE